MLTACLFVKTSSHGPAGGKPHYTFGSVPGTRSAGSVLEYVIGERAKRTTDQPNYAVGVTTRPPALDSVGMTENAPDQTPVGSTDGQMLEISSQCRKTKDAGSALARTLPSHISGNAGSLGQTTRPARESHNYAYSDSGARSRQWARSIGSGELMSGEPRSSISTDERARQVASQPGQSNNVDH
jgi:hypothetical protein